MDVMHLRWHMISLQRIRIKTGIYQYMMVGYKLENTLTDNGHVARGVCVTDEEGYLKDINERTHIEKRDGGAAYTG